MKKLAIILLTTLVMPNVNAALSVSKTIAIHAPIPTSVTCNIQNYYCDIYTDNSIFKTVNYSTTNINILKKSISINNKMIMLKTILILILVLQTFQKSDVYFTKEITSHKMVEMLQKLNLKLTGNIGLKVHSGEPNGKYFLTPDFLQEIYDYTKGTFIECNTAYSSVRSSSSSHKNLLDQNNWAKNSRRVVIMDENPEDDIELTVENPQKISKNYVGGKIKDFNSIVVLSHFKGHQMGGFGGALKQLSIGFASQKGKTVIHTAGQYTDWHYAMSRAANQIDFTSSMADAASTIMKYFPEGQIGFVTVLANISSSCDCAGSSAPAPQIHDIGILASTDPVAIDKACLDLIKSNVDTGTDYLLNQISRLEGENTIKVAEQIGVGSQEYNLINVDEGSGNGDGNGDGKTDNDNNDPNDYDEEEEIRNLNGEFLRSKYLIGLISLLILVL